MEMAAKLSDDGVYRYWLERVWDKTLPILLVVMLNPSTADHTVNDPTILTLIKRATRWGFGGIRVINLFAVRSSDPKVMMAHADPIGPDNIATISNLITMAKLAGRWVLIAWGNGGSFQDMDQRFVRHCVAKNVEMRCLGTTQSGQPKHPLARGLHRIPEDFEPIPYG